jgi:glycosyltransferase involved in cell wall biosynthesis
MKQPFISVIMPSHLAAYKNAASDRRNKLIRAINSVINQTFADWELLILADGCKETFDLVCDLYGDRANIGCYLIDKQPFLSPNIRNYPISQAQGKYICYLDSDDYFGLCHLKTIADQIDGEAWGLMDDLIPEKSGAFRPRKARLLSGQCGTANIAHRRDLNAKWRTPVYGRDDWDFIRDLLNITAPKIINGGQYHVCHIPYKFDL